MDFSLLSHIAYFKSVSAKNDSRKDALKALYPALTLIEDRGDPCSQGKDFFAVEVMLCCCCAAAFRLKLSPLNTNVTFFAGYRQEWHGVPHSFDQGHV